MPHALIVPRQEAEARMQSLPGARLTGVVGPNAVLSIPDPLPDPDPPPTASSHAQQAKGLVNLPDLKLPGRSPAQQPPGVPTISPGGRGIQRIQAALASNGFKSR